MGIFKYNDILNMKYPCYEIEADFPDRILRAAQFAPFAALTGHGDAINETARLTDAKIELDEYEKEALNRKLVYLKDILENKPEVIITCFVPDSKKSGGRYVDIRGRIKKIREYERDIVLEDNSIIMIDNIFFIEGEVFNEL